MLTTLRNGFLQNATRSWFAIQAKGAPDAADVLIYDYIGWGGVTAADFAQELRTVQAKTLTVRLNTPGGDVFDGLAIYNSLRAHGAQIHVKIEGLAASIGSIIAMAGDQITMAESSFLMMHNPWALVIGNAKDMREMAATLDKVGGSLAGIYATRPLVTKEQAQVWMDDETWFTAEEAVAARLSDQVAGVVDEPAVAARFDLSTYAHVPPALAATPSREAVKTVPDSETVRRAAQMRQRVALITRGERSR